MVAIGQTITIVNKSGKVVSTSKHLVNVFNEAKTAYNERKAEIKAHRRDKAAKQLEDKKTLKRLEGLDIKDDDASSKRSSRRGSEDGKSTRSKRTERPPMERGVSDSFYTNDLSPSRQRRSSHRPSPLRSDSHQDEPRVGELTRRHTDGLELQQAHRSSTPPRRASADDIDMDLAYGELPPPLPERRLNDEIALRQKVTGLQRMLDEANCLQHSVTAMIDNLQKNPDALAAVALTLAEISSLASKMAPGALMSMKTAFPAVIALLASPEFLIAGGVAVGVTIIAFGGYKIIKKIKAKNASQEGLAIEDAPRTPDEETEMESLREISRIDLWRRGIADVEAESAGSTVDGEFITPQATKALMAEGKLTEADLKSRDSDGKKKQRKHRSSRSGRNSKTKSESGRTEKVKKEPSGIRMLFKGHS